MTVPTHIAIDQSACIRAQSNIGETVLHNICDGTAAVVPWGAADWLGFVAMAGVSAGIAVLFAFLSWLMFDTIRGSY